MSTPTELHLPPNLPYPIKVLSLVVNPSQPIDRGTSLLNYSFVHAPASATSKAETRFGTWDSTLEGVLEDWRIEAGETISERRARERPAALVTEPCKHGVQVGGLCAMCGKDMTAYDYLGFSDGSRASIQMTHSASGPTVSLEEAERIERETMDHLLKSKKLSLIVDLDQTIVHATVDPTVGEWISEGEEWEKRRAKRAREVKVERDGSSSDSSSESDDEVNPNWEALRDVKRFRLGPDLMGQPRLRVAPIGKGKQKAIENDGCVYYIKPRPGWQEFLQDAASKYEMHVYTMGTRAYAEEVCAAIDADGKLFGGRLLSRDESGSLTQKSLQRLFPCDTSMVVIIDDRADVWEWSPNLVKVIPYDFFVGIGDINSTFLPKLESLSTVIPPKPPASDSPNAPPSGSLIDNNILPLQPVKLSFPPSPVPPGTLMSTSDAETEAAQSERTNNALLTQNTLALEAQLEERPLAKKQEQLLETNAESSISQDDGVVASPIRNVSTAGITKEPPTIKKAKPSRTALLKNDDSELERVGKILDEVHKRFFDAYELDAAKTKNKHHQRTKGHHRRTQPPYDVKAIIPQLRTETLAGVHILFSSVIPLDTNPEATEIWRLAHAFGATCHTELSNRITHVVAAKRGTVKVDAARKRGGIKIVWLSWFTDSIALWRRQDETPYLLDDPSQVKSGPASSSPLDSAQISSDPEPDADDWDKERNEGPINTLELDDVNWDDINNEVDAAMNESDSEADVDERRSMNGSESSWADETESNIGSAPGTPKRKRKRLRSSTPSELRVTLNDTESDVLRSPLAKRKRIAAERSGSSMLKMATLADELTADSEHSQDVNGDGVNEDDMDEEGEEEDVEEGDDEDEDVEDDFLARELEEEWG